MTEEPIDELLVLELAAMREHDRSKTGISVRLTRQYIESRLTSVRQSGDIEGILDAEKAILEHDLQYHVNSLAMRGSLETSLAELRTARRMVKRARDPAMYRETDANFRLPRNRIGGVPRDEARQFFRSHAARLLNQDKSRLHESEKRILYERRSNMRRAEKLYAALQERALGDGADREQDRGLGRASRPGA